MRYVSKENCVAKSEPSLTINFFLVNKNTVTLEQSQIMIRELTYITGPIIQVNFNSTPTPNPLFDWSKIEIFVVITSNAIKKLDLEEDVKYTDDQLQS